MKKVVIFTTFSDIQKAYSLNILTQCQIKQLLLNGYQPTVIVHESFQPEGIYAHPSVKIEKIPNVAVFNEVKKDENFEADVTAIANRLMEILKDKDVVITHDVIYQNAALKHNFASRGVAARLPGLRWLHWIHSATSPALFTMIRPIFGDEYLKVIQTPFPYAKYVYPNSYAVPAVANNFNIMQEDVRVVHHPTDICQFFGMSDEVEQTIYDKDILSADAISTYPIRLDRGKQVQFVIKTMAALKDFGLSIRLIIADFHSTGGDKITYREELKALTIDLGLNSSEVIFLSEQRMGWQSEVPQSVIRDFQIISNVFILPSVSETYSLITQEAGLCKQVLVLNQDFPPMRSIYGENAIYRKYSSNWDALADVSEGNLVDSHTMTKYGSANLPEEARKSAEMDYHRGTAGMIAARLRHPEMALSIFLRKNRNLQAVFKKETEVLFYE